MMYRVFGVEDGRKPELVGEFKTYREAKEYSDRVWAVDDDYDRMRIEEVGEFVRSSI